MFPTRLSRFRVVVTCFALTSLFSHSSFANTNADTSEFDIVDATANSTVETISIISQRNMLGTEGLVNQSTESINFAELNDSQVRIADLLSTLSGVDISGQGGLFQSYSVRGFSRWRLRTEVDGIPIFTDRRAGNSVSFLPQALMSGLSVSKGPSSTLYGSDALGGVVSVFSSGYGQNKLGFSRESDGANTELFALLSTDIGDHQIQSGMVHKESKRRSDANGNPLDDGFKQTTGLVKYKSDINDIDIEAMLLTSKGSDIGKSSGLFPNDQQTSYPSEFHNLAKLQISESQKWLLSIYHHYQNWDTDTLRVGSRRNFTEYQSNTLGLTGLSSLDFLGGKGRAGIDIVSRRGVDINDKEFNLEGDIQSDLKILQGQKDNIGLFVDQHWRFSDFSVSAGVRFDQIEQSEELSRSSMSAKRVNYSFNSEWLLTENLILHAEFGTGFRFPTLSELFFNGLTPRGNTIGNPELESEKSRGGQFSVDYAFSNNIDFNLQTYYYALDDYIERFRLENRDRTFRNLDEATIKGFESSVVWRINENYTQTIAYQQQSGEDQDGTTLSDILGDRIDFKTQWQSGKWTVDNLIQYAFSQNQFGDGEAPLDSYTDWSLTLAMELNDDVQLSLYARNILNEDIRAALDEDAPQLQGRNIGLRLVYQL